MPYVENPPLDELFHYGMPRRSGRYPYGSGKDPGQHGSSDFLTRVDELKKNGWKETPENIRNEFGISTTTYREEIHNAKNMRKLYKIQTAKSLEKDGLGATDIGKKMGESESTIRGWLKEDSEIMATKTRTTADFIKNQIDTKGMIDVGAGIEKELGISQTRLNNALKLLEDEGYPVYSGRFDQINNPGKKTTQKVVCPPGTKHKEIYDFEKVKTIDEYVSRDGGDTFDKFVYPKSMDSSRLKIRYADDKGADGITGIQKDGIVELRRGVPDLSLGDSRYSQVRILVDGKKYIKGVAVYSDDMPKGVDIVFNTNKKPSVAKLDVLKDIKNDPDNPFGSLIKAKGQSEYIDKNGKKQLSLINKTREEGDWSDWKDTLPSQFLSKQSRTMAKKQLDLAKADKIAELDTISKLNNPTIKKHLLSKFADECDASAVHLKAAALPGQKHHVIIPINTLKDDEVFAPKYRDGSKLALIRYPHGGTFEIPICKVNNKNVLAKKILGLDVDDAIGINSKVAERLSGADFDGDTVMCIPTHDRMGKVRVTSTKALQGLKGFDPKTEYAERPGMKYMKNPKTGADSTQMEMGKISNLITDMTLGGATPDKLARAVKHSMVVIDAGKHKLDYKKSYVDNNIKALVDEYQRSVDPKTGEVHIGGASTLISRAKGEQPVLKRQGSPKVNIKGKDWYDPTRPEGSLLYKTADDLEYTVTKVNKRTGVVTTKVKQRTQKSSKMAETDDANTLLSDAKHPMEKLYADYANDMKALANKARVQKETTGKIAYNKDAAKKYKKEVQELKTKVDRAMVNAPREREAQRRANVAVAKKTAADPTMKKSDIKKVGQQALTKYRAEVGAVARRKRNIDITDREWEAIQSGAVSEAMLTRILNNTDIAALRQRATPKAYSTSLNSSQVSRIKAMSASNYTIAQIAEKMGVSSSTVSNYLKGGK